MRRALEKLALVTDSLSASRAMEPTRFETMGAQHPYAHSLAGLAARHAYNGRCDVGALYPPKRIQCSESSCESIDLRSFGGGLSSSLKRAMVEAEESC